MQSVGVARTDVEVRVVDHDDRELPAGVIDNQGHYEVDPALMSVYPQFATDFEVDRIVTGRLEYLYWVQRHFADRVLPPRAEDAGQ